MATLRTVGQLIEGRPVFTCRATDSLRSAFDLQKLHRVHRLPVLGAKNELVGVLSVSDLRLAIESPLFHQANEIRERFESSKVSDVMHKIVETLSPEDLLVNAAKLLRLSSYGGMPVVTESGTVVGMFTRTDVLDEYIRVIQPLTSLKEEQPAEPTEGDQKAV